MISETNICYLFSYQVNRLKDTEGCRNERYMIRSSKQVILLVLLQMYPLAKSFEVKTCDDCRRSHVKCLIDAETSRCMQCIKWDRACKFTSKRPKADIKRVDQTVPLKRGAPLKEGCQQGFYQAQPWASYIRERYQIWCMQCIKKGSPSEYTSKLFRNRVDRLHKRTHQRGSVSVRDLYERSIRRHI